MLELGVASLHALDFFLLLDDLLLVGILVHKNHSVGLVEGFGLLLVGLCLADVRGPLELLSDGAEHQVVAHQNLVCLLTAGAAVLEFLHLFDFLFCAFNDFDYLVEFRQFHNLPLHLLFLSLHLGLVPLNVFFLYLVYVGLARQSRYFILELVRLVLVVAVLVLQLCDRVRLFGAYLLQRGALLGQPVPLLEHLLKLCCQLAQTFLFILWHVLEELRSLNIVADDEAVGEPAQALSSVRHSVQRADGIQLERLLDAVLVVNVAAIRDAELFGQLLEANGALGNLILFDHYFFKNIEQ